MAQAKQERLMNLIAYLSDTARPLTVREIIETVPGYPESFSAARRAFERDKETLRAMNFDVEVLNTPSGDTGYRIRKDNTYFDIELTASQRSIIEYALAIYSPDKNLASNAVTKLGGSNPENEVTEIFSLSLPSLFEDLYLKCQEKKSISILFKGDWRTIIPKRLIARSGYWYCEAYDENKGQPRTFRIDRIAEIKDAISGEPEVKTQNIEDEINYISVVLKAHPSLLQQLADSYNGQVNNQESTVTFDIPRKELLLNNIYNYAGFVSVIAPPELKEEINHAQKALIDELSEP